MYMEYYNQPFQKLTYSDIKVHDWCKRGSCVSLSLSNKHLFFRKFLLHGRVVKSYALIIIRGFILYTISRFSIRKCFPSSKPKVCQVDLFQLYTVVIIFTYRTISKKKSIFTHSYEINSYSNKGRRLTLSLIIVNFCQDIEHILKKYLE